MNCKEDIKRNLLELTEKERDETTNKSYPVMDCKALAGDSSGYTVKS